MELAKNERWLGGNTPTGFSVKRVTQAMAKTNPFTAIENITQDKAMIQKLFEIFRQHHSIKKTADKMNKLGFRIKVGFKFNASTTRPLLKNPVYCVAGKISYNYFYENGGGLCTKFPEFNSQYGLSAYS